MPPGLEMKRKLAQISEKVESVDMHPTEPWILTSSCSGTVFIWNYQSQTMVKPFEVTELPVRSAKFIARKQWVVVGADDMYIRVYNYNTRDEVKVFEAHTDFIRCVAVHPTLPYVLSSSDDMRIKLWDWEKGWVCTQIFEGHSHYVMQVTFNPKDTNTFASASLDNTIKIWNLGSPNSNFTLCAHLKGVNCVDYFMGGDKPYLITGSDDYTAKVWDYQTKSCVQTLEGHTHNVSAVCFHPELPIIITGCEGGTVCLWHATTYRLENTLNYGLKSVRAIRYMKGSHWVVIGYDEGTIMVKFGREEPVASMDNSGKIISAKHNEIQTVNIESVGADYEVTDGERLPLSVKELGTCDLYPQIVDKYCPLLAAKMESQRQHYELPLAKAKNRRESSTSEAVEKVVASKMQGIQRELENLAEVYQNEVEINKELMKKLDVSMEMVKENEERNIPSLLRSKDAKIADLEDEIRDLKAQVECQRQLANMTDTDDIKGGALLPQQSKQSTPANSRRHTKFSRRRN